MNTQENPIVETSSLSTKKKVTYGKLSPEAKEALGRMSIGAKEMQTISVAVEKPTRKVISYKMEQKGLTVLWWCWNIGATIDMICTYVGLFNDKNFADMVTQQFFNVPFPFMMETPPKFVLWAIPAINWLLNLGVGRLIYEIAFAVYEILNRLREQDNDIYSIKRTVESLEKKGA